MYNYDYEGELDKIGLNTYKYKKIGNMSYKILKNYYDELELRSIIDMNGGYDLTYYKGERFWWVSYEVH